MKFEHLEHLMQEHNLNYNKPFIYYVQLNYKKYGNYALVKVIYSNGHIKKLNILFCKPHNLLNMCDH